jgi:hypothetical protein
LSFIASITLSDSLSVLSCRYPGSAKGIGDTLGVVVREYSPVAHAELGFSELPRHEQIRNAMRRHVKALGHFGNQK